MIEEIPIDALAGLYNTHIVNDFPSSERRPLSNIRSLYKKGCYTGLIFKEKGDMLAYACFLHNAKKEGGLLLDYYAVCRELRNSGIGSRFLQELREYWTADGIIIESEMPSKARDEDERQLRERRIGFYLRNGAALADHGWSVFGVHYNLLWLPIQRAVSEVNIGEQIQSIYALSMPKWMQKHATCLYRL